MLKDFLYNNSTERKGSFILIALILVLTASCWLWPFFQRSKKTDFSKFKTESEEFINGLNLAEAEEGNEYTYKTYEKKARKTYQNNSKAEKEPEALTPFPFNPNDADADLLLDLGLPEKTVKSILNYREKGGKFKTKSDFSKIYSLKPEDFEILSPFIQLPDSIEKKSFPEKKTEQKFTKESPPVLDINSATAADFDKLPGIGPSFADRIVKYRETLGGFVNTAQMEEIYGLSDSTLTKISPYLRCTAKSARKININTASAEELKSHPYLKWRHANAIVKYREKNGPYSSVETLRILNEFNDSEGTFWKIKPYLSL